MASRRAGVQVSVTNTASRPRCVSRSDAQPDVDGVGASGHVMEELAAGEGGALADLRALDVAADANVVAAHPRRAPVERTGGDRAGAVALLHEAERSGERAGDVILASRHVARRPRRARAAQDLDRRRQLPSRRPAGSATTRARRWCSTCAGSRGLVRRPPAGRTARPSSSSADRRSRRRWRCVRSIPRRSARAPAASW